MSQNIAYNDDFMQASEYLRQVLPFLSKHQIPASPLNYQIGYDYVSGSNAALKRAVDDKLEKTGNLSEAHLLALYKMHIAQDDKALETVRFELQKIITNIQSQYDNSNGELSDYLTSLNGFADFLTGSEDSDELAAEVKKVVENTRSTEQSQRNFESQMSNMMEEMDSLRKQLEQVREESLTDALTGLANRKAFDERLDELMTQHQQDNKAFCVVIGDIDHFKKFNDTYGHLVGDKVLRYVATTIKSCVKGKDMAARFGGEEFVILLPDTEMTGAEKLAEQVREAICEKVLKDNRNNEEYGKITMSLGIGQFSLGETPDNLLKRADDALYQAKENGRNRVEKAA